MAFRMKPLEVILDTNVIVAAMRSRNGASFALLRSLGTDPRWRIHLSTALVLEYTEQVYLNRAAANWTTQDCDDFLGYLCSVAVEQKIFFRWRPQLRDPDDEFLLDLALAANASHIITFNTSDFSAAASHGIKTVKPGEFLLHLANEP